MRAKPMNIENYDVSVREYKAFRKHACDLASILFLKLPYNEHNEVHTNSCFCISWSSWFGSRLPLHVWPFHGVCVCNVKSHAQLETSQAEPNRTEPNCLFLIFIAHFFDRDQLVSHREKKVLDALKMKMISDKIDYQINRV